MDLVLILTVALSGAIGFAIGRFTTKKAVRDQNRSDNLPAGGGGGGLGYRDEKPNK